jgi:hypothetical protein
LGHSGWAPVPLSLLFARKVKADSSPRSKTERGLIS